MDSDRLDTVDGALCEWLRGGLDLLCVISHSIRVELTIFFLLLHFFSSQAVSRNHSLTLSLTQQDSKEKRISTMTEVQIMEKLRSVVSDEDPKGLYSKIKKVGRG